MEEDVRVFLEYLRLLEYFKNSKLRRLYQKQKKKNLLISSVFFFLIEKQTLNGMIAYL